MKRLTIDEFNDFWEQHIDNTEIILPNEDGDERYFVTITMTDIEATPPFHRVSMKTADLEEQILYMPRDIFGKAVGWIGNVFEGLFVKEKV